jgi:hypothetical protein
MTDTYFAVAKDDIAMIPAAPAAVVHEANGNVPEARDLTWTDTFYDDSSTGVIAVFDVDHEKLKRSIGCKLFLIAVLAFFYGLFFGSYMLGDGDSESDMHTFAFDVFPYIVMMVFVPALYAIERQIKGVHGMHVAVTNEGIRKDLRQFPLGAIRTTTIASTVDQTTIREISHACVFFDSRNVFFC